MRVLIGIAAGAAIAGAVALSAGSASAQDWCGFHQKANSKVRCGYSSLQVCKQALAEKKSGDKTVTCLPDPASG
jgi:hypothetical protein